MAVVGSSFPFLCAISWYLSEPESSNCKQVLNFIYLRTYAYDLLATTRRPPYQCASDIGTWQARILKSQCQKSVYRDVLE